MTCPLYNAVVSCRLTHAKYLLEHDCAVNRRNNDGETPLIGALRWITNRERRLRVFRWLLRRGADLDLCDSVTQRDALLWAAFLNRTDAIRHLLIDLHIDVDLRRRDVFGRCALHYAVLHNNEQAVLWLTRRHVKYQVPVDVTDECDVTPLRIASTLGLGGCAHILREIGRAVRSSPDLKMSPSLTLHADLWRGTQDWSDPRFAVEKSQKLDKIFMQSLPSISSKTKVKFNDVIETIELEETGKQPARYRSRRFQRKTTQSTVSPFTKLPPLTSKSDTSQWSSFNQQQQEGQNVDKKKKFVFLKRLPRSALEYSYNREKTLSVKRKQLPLIFDLYAEQISPAFHTAAKPSQQQPQQQNAPRRHKKTSKAAPPPAKPALTLGVLGKVTKFAAIIKLKAAQRHNNVS